MSFGAKGSPPQGSPLPTPLPSDPHERALALVARSSPNPDRPRGILSPAIERQLEQADRDRAVMYASMEDITDRLHQLANEIDRSSEGVFDCVNFDVGDDGGDAVVVHIDEVQRAAMKAAK